LDAESCFTGYSSSETFETKGVNSRCYQGQLFKDTSDLKYQEFQK